MLNYLYGLAASQLAIGLAEVGLDPGIGIFHADKEGRLQVTPHDGFILPQRQFFSF